MDNFSALQEGLPFKSYKKTILGKVYLVTWDNFTESPSSVLLVGDPRNDEDGSIIDVWSVKEDLFLKNMNKLHFKRGTLVEYKRPTVAKEKSIEESSDEELEALINAKYFTLQNKLNEIESEAVLYRMLDLANRNEKSVKIISSIQQRLSELQGQE